MLKLQVGILSANTPRFGNNSVHASLLGILANTYPFVVCHVCWLKEYMNAKTEIRSDNELYAPPV